MTWLVALLATLTVAPAPAVSAQAAPRNVSQAAQADDVYMLYLIRLNCDDEAEHFSDEVELVVDGVYRGGRGDMDGGDWWDINQSYPFSGSIHVKIRENDGWPIGEVTIGPEAAGRGLIVVPMNGFHGTHYRYRLTYSVEGPI
ncbi:hypothetical protein [Nonomuraea typhae]|uniref:Uncharacterized protein n=1 Tax=Nonomuraea typhae TaxID=2603600 RepID=A0ABW7YWR8_9ACTN